MLEGRVFFDVCQGLIRNRHPVIYQRGRTELFSQWFRDQPTFENINAHLGTHPDIVITETSYIEGYELKSARSRNAQVQYNSTPPCGTMSYGNRRIKGFYVFADYNLDTSQEVGHLQDLVIVDGDFINSDYALVERHRTDYEPCGSYGDGRIRHRRMYHFPNPMSLLESGILLVSKDSNLEAQFSEFVKLHLINRLDRADVKNVFYVYAHKSLMA